MKSILTILLVIFWQVAFCQTKIEWDVADLYDTVTNQLKPGPHSVIVKRITNRRSTYDTIKIQVMGDSSEFEVNYMPVAFAGNDTTWTYGKTATVSGKGVDPDGKIIAFKWSRKGPTLGKISYSTRATTTLTGLAKGVHTLTLTVTDDKGGSARDEVVITVK